MRGEGEQRDMGKVMSCQTRMKGIRHGGVVDKDTLRDISIEERQVFHIMPAMVHTALSEETVVDHLSKGRQ
jgi:hypothetical protein